MFMKLLVASLMAAVSPSTAATQGPAVDVLYLPGGSLLDRLCTSDFKVAVDDKNIQAAAQMRPEFQRRWDTDGPAYVVAAMAEVGLDFPYREVQATLTVCLPASTSVPLVIDVKPFLPTATKPAPDWEFAEVLFHELMHTYVSRVYGESALMKKYQNESATTRFHLHVMAVERVTMLKLNRPEQLAVIDHDYRTGPDPQYRRAWEIDSDIEGYQPFISELKALRKPRQ
jgi:hypothetical protein